MSATEILRFSCNARSSIIVWSNGIMRGEGVGEFESGPNTCVFWSHRKYCFRERFRVIKRHFLPEAGPTSYFLSKASIVGVLEAKFWSCNHVAISVKWVPFGGPPEKKNMVRTSRNTNLWKFGRTEKFVKPIYVQIL